MVLIFKEKKLRTAPLLIDFRSLRCLRELELTSESRRLILDTLTFFVTSVQNIRLLNHFYGCDLD